jgi:hypothetical protein
VFGHSDASDANRRLSESRRRFGVTIVNVPLIVAGSLSLLGAAIHGIAGERLVVRKVMAGGLPSTAFGSSRMTETMVHVTWHLVTVTFVCFGVALLLSGSVVGGEAARGISVVVAAAYTAFWAVALVMAAAYMRSARFLLLHPAPALFSLIVALAWWGAL